MSTELREYLQTTLGGAYTLERELGGGGMARVFVAEETRLGRCVVVKVLAPDLAAGLSPERFRAALRRPGSRPSRQRLTTSVASSQVCKRPSVKTWPLASQ